MSKIYRCLIEIDFLVLNDYLVNYNVSLSNKRLKIETYFIIMTILKIIKKESFMFFQHGRKQIQKNVYIILVEFFWQQTPKMYQI